MSTDIIRDVFLWGSLGEKFGHHHRLVVRCPAEAMRAIECNRPGFLGYIKKLHDQGLVFACSIGDRLISGEQIFLPLGADALHVAPVVRGAGGKNGGFVEVVLGVLLIAGALIFGPVGAVGGAASSTAFAGGFLTGGEALYIGALGASLALNGIASMLTPKPAFDVNQDEPDKHRPSDFFGGAVNTTAQGQPVPVLYGRAYVGSATISLGVENRDKTAEEAASGQ